MEGHAWGLNSSLGTPKGRVGSAPGGRGGKAARSAVSELSLASVFTGAAAWLRLGAAAERQDPSLYRHRQHRPRQPWTWAARSLPESALGRARSPP